MEKRSSQRGSNAYTSTLEKISFLYLIHSPRSFLWLVIHSWLSCCGECCLNHEVFPRFSTAQYSMFLLFVITTYSLRFNTNVLLQLDSHMKILVCTCVCLPPYFSLTSSKMFWNCSECFEKFLHWVMLWATLVWLYFSKFFRNAASVSDPMLPKSIILQLWDTTYAKQWLWTG